MTSYVSLDVSLAETSVCVLDENGKPGFEGRVASQPEALIRCLTKHAADVARVGLETGQSAGVLFRALKAAGAAGAVLGDAPRAPGAVGAH